MTKIDPVAHRGRFIFVGLSLARDSLSSRVQRMIHRNSNRTYFIALDDRAVRPEHVARTRPFLPGNRNGNSQFFQPLITGRARACE